MIKTNSIKKGMRVILANGWRATIEDNKKGNIRLATVEGYFFTEMGSIYAWDIEWAYTEEGLIRVALTDAQKKAREKIQSL